jgi:AcrR family transcriptional regulator
MGRPTLIDNDTILAQARVLFAEHGPSLSTQAIAQSLGISQATLFKRFGSKDKLFFAAMTSAPPLPELPEAGSEAQTYLTAFVTRLLTHVEAFSPVVMSLMSHPGFNHYIQQAHQPDLHQAVVQRLTQALTLFQQAGQIHAQVNVAALVCHLVETLHGHVLLRLMTGTDPTPAADRATQLVNVLWQGLKPEAG